jgi:hypothetical protein
MTVYPCLDACLNYIGAGVLAAGLCPISRRSHIEFRLRMCLRCCFWVVSKSVICNKSRQNRIGNMVFGNLAMLKIIHDIADKISVSAYNIWWRFPPCTLAMRRTLISFCLIISSLNVLYAPALDDLCIWMALLSCMYKYIGHGEEAGFAFSHWISPL